MKQAWSVLLGAFPDLQVEVEDLIAAGDKIVSCSTVRGPHQGEPNPVVEVRPPGASRIETRPPWTHD